MKIRTGFVSNSSSSSFCLLGIEASNKKYGVDTEEIYEEIEKTDLENENSIEWDGDQYLGMSPAQMKDDETLLQFKQRIVDELKKLNITAEVSDLFWEIQGGYNG